MWISRCKHILSSLEDKQQCQEARESRITEEALLKLLRIRMFMVKNTGSIHAIMKTLFVSLALTLLMQSWMSTWHLWIHIGMHCISQLILFCNLWNPSVIGWRGRHTVPCTRWHTSKFTCAIYRTREIIVFSRKEKFFIEGFSIEHN